jgi:hypothetical protein
MHLAYNIASISAHSGVQNRSLLYQMYEQELRKARFVSSSEAGPIIRNSEDWLASRNTTMASPDFTHG